MGLAEVRVERGKYVFVFSHPHAYGVSVTVVVEGDRILVDTGGLLVDHKFIGDCVSKSLECIKDISKCVEEIRASKPTRLPELKEVVLHAVRVAAERSGLGCAKKGDILQVLLNQKVQISEEKLAKIIEALRREGEIYEKRLKCYALS